MPCEVVTRFAPSPTGYLHIGGARTALFNWLYARAHGGKFLLRIEDTDRARSSKEAVDALLDGLNWLGLNWDGDAIYQHTRADRHAEVAQSLLRSGKAYACYCTPQELADMRARARAEGRPPGYDGTWRDRDPADAPPDALPAIRFKAPREGVTVIDDHVQGSVTFQNKELDDLILLRSDGTPTYMLSVVVDDHDMGITHVIRGDDHLTNAARQSQIYDALDWARPEFAHVPLIHGPDGAKLSKRHGALGVEAYRALGYLPAALRNYLVRLGWSHGDEEIFSSEQLIELFSLSEIGRSPARFDFAKLAHLNGHYMRTTNDKELVRYLRDALPEMEDGRKISEAMGPKEWQALEQAMPGLKERAKTLCELIENARYIYEKRPITLNPRAEKLLDAQARAHLAELLPKLSSATAWSAQELEQIVRAHAEESGLKLGKLAQPLRAALTGSSVSPGIYDVLVVLGRDESIARIADQTTTKA